MSVKTEENSSLKRMFLCSSDVFFYYGSNILRPFGFLLLFVFMLGRDRENFIAYSIDKKWWLISALSLLMTAFIMRRQSRFWREERVKRKVRCMFRHARKNARKK